MAKARPFDAAEYLDSPEMIAAYLTEALESNEQALITKAIGNVARARGMTEVAEKAGVAGTGKAWGTGCAWVEMRALA